MIDEIHFERIVREEVSKKLSDETWFATVVECVVDLKLNNYIKNGNTLDKVVRNEIKQLIAKKMEDTFSIIITTKE